MQSSTTLFGTGLLLAGAAYLLGRKHSTATKCLGDATPTKLGKTNPDAGDPIDITKAKKVAKKYKSEFEGNILAHYCRFEPIKQLQETTNCYGIRIYRTYSDDGSIGIVIVGTDDKGRDIYKSKDNKPRAVLAIESYERCPSNCDGTIHD